MIRYTNLVLINDPSNPGEYGTENISMFVNPHIEGFLIGMSPRVATSMGDLFTSNGTIFGVHSGRSIEGGYLNNLVNIVLDGMQGNSDQTAIRNVTFGKMSNQDVAIASAKFDAFGNNTLARTKFEDTIMDMASKSMQDLKINQQINILYHNSYKMLGNSRDDSKLKEALEPRGFTMEVDGVLYSLMGKREQQADFVPFPSWRFSNRGGGFSKVLDKTNAQLYDMSKADHNAMIRAIHGEIDTGQGMKNTSHPDYRKTEFPGWEFVQGGYVIPKNWESNSDYLDGDDFGMENVVLRKMKDENGRPIQVDWEDANAGPVTAPDYLKDSPSRKGGTVFKLSDLIGNDYDSDRRATNPHDQEFPVHQKYNSKVPLKSLLTLVSMEQPQHGRIEEGNFEFKYFAPAGFTGVDSVRYRIADLSGKDVWETAYIFVGTGVNPSIVNHVPEAGDDSFTVSRGKPVVLDVLANDVDPEGGALKVVQVGFPDHKTDVGMPQFGTAEIVNGQLVYTPSEYFTGTDRFIYIAADESGARTRRGEVSVTMDGNDIVVPPPTNNDPNARNDSATTDEDNPVTINVLNNDRDSDGDALSVTSAGDASNGTTRVNGDGTITYTPDAGFSGNDSFDYTIDDGNGGQATATVNVTIASVNDAPVARGDTAATDEDNAVIINVLGNDSDA
ncbi:Ig-like domain-containing protein, partial [Planctomycetota bacterium]